MTLDIVALWKLCGKQRKEELNKKLLLTSNYIAVSYYTELMEYTDIFAGGILYGIETMKSY